MAAHPAELQYCRLAIHNRIRVRGIDRPHGARCLSDAAAGLVDPWPDPTLQTTGKTTTPQGTANASKDAHWRCHQAHRARSRDRCWVAQIVKSLQAQGLGTESSDLTLMATNQLVVDARRLQFRRVFHHGNLRGGGPVEPGPGRDAQRLS